ncbi:MAG: inositol monophosphatase [Clostridium sp.]|nr:inositol monophosphatase [Clostridium sp.]
MRKAGKIILEAKLTGGAVHDKQGPANFVTDYDILIQRELIAGLRGILPEASFFGEEETEGSLAGSGPRYIGGYCFYIDPIDGTTNFMFDYHHSCVSLGLSFERRMLAGFVYNPYVDEMYAAVRGKGAFLNGKKLILPHTPLAEGIAAFGCARYNDDRVEEIFQIVRELFMESIAVRSGGSAALDLCRIASGSNVCYFELKLQPYDYAAASIIIEEAGGKITQADGSPITLDRPCSIVGGTVKAHGEVIEIIKKKGV